MPKLQSPYRAKAKNISEFIKEQVATAQSLEEILSLMRNVTRENTELFNVLKGKLRTSFSKWDWKSVKSRFGLKEVLPTWKPRSCRVPKFIIDWTLTAIDRVRVTHGAVNRGKEIRRNLYIQMLLSSIAYAFKGNITIDDEGALHSTLSGGFVEFVLYVLDEVVAFIIESKTEIVSDSIAQLFMELHASQMNSIAGFYIPKLRGAVSTAATWTFFEYLTTFPAPKPLYNEDSEDEEDLENNEISPTFQLSESALYLCTTDEEVTTVSSILYWILLQGWCDVQEQYQIWVRAHQEASKHPKRTKKLAAVNAALQAAKKRHENAKQVMTAAMEADDDDKAEAALNMLTTTFTNPEFYLA